MEISLGYHGSIGESNLANAGNFPAEFPLSGGLQLHHPGAIFQLAMFGRGLPDDLFMHPTWLYLRAGRKL